MGVSKKNLIKSNRIHIVSNNSPVVYVDRAVWSGPTIQTQTLIATVRINASTSVLTRQIVRAFQQFATVPATVAFLTFAVFKAEDRERERDGELAAG